MLNYSKVHKTFDYDMFFDPSPERSREWIERIKESISKIDFLHLKPIIVTSTGEILDGRLRLLAAKELSKPIYYIILEDDMEIKNSILRKKSFQNISAQVVMKDGKFICKVIAYHTPMKTVVEVRGPDVEYQRSAGGWGYDRYTCALAGCVIDGHVITDHAQEQLPLPKEGVFPIDFVPPTGYYTTNWNAERNGWTHCFKTAGLGLLRDHGYQIIGVI